MDLARERYSEVFESNMFKWCPEGDLNPHNPCGSADFKSAASANFAIRARVNQPCFKVLFLFY